MCSSEMLRKPDEMLGGGDLARDWHPIQWGIVILLAAPCYIETEISSRWMGHWTQVQTSL